MIGTARSVVSSLCVLMKVEANKSGWMVSRAFEGDERVGHWPAQPVSTVAHAFCAYPLCHYLDFNNLTTAQVHHVCDADPTSPCGKQLEATLDAQAKHLNTSRENITSARGEPPYIFDAACAGCHSDESVEKKLLRCGKCGLIRYCR